MCIEQLTIVSLGVTIANFATYMCVCDRVFRYCPKCNSTDACGCDSAVESRRQSSRGWRDTVQAANTADEGDETVGQEQKVRELYIDYKDFIRVIQFRLELMEV